jgi:hypothetical protein
MDNENIRSPDKIKREQLIPDVGYYNDDDDIPEYVRERCFREREEEEQLEQLLRISREEYIKCQESQEQRKKEMEPLTIRVEKLSAFEKLSALQPNQSTLVILKNILHDYIVSPSTPVQLTHEEYTQIVQFMDDLYTTPKNNHKKVAISCEIYNTVINHLSRQL